VKVVVHVDGGARGNPGPAAFAYVLEAEDGTVLAAHGEAIGVATNNVAEYRGLVEGLRKLSVEAGRLARQLKRVTYRAVRREHNELADRLVNEALDAA
jgi:ribonuclease HI